MHRLLTRLSYAVALAIAFGPALHAATITYSSAGSFAAATTGLTTYNFPGTYASRTTRTYTTGPLAFQQGVSGSPDGSYYATFNDGLYGANQSYLELTNTTSNTEVETILLSSSITALGFQIGGQGGAYSVAVNGSTIAAFTTPSGDTVPFPSVFFGVTNTTPITSISFTTNAVDTDTLFVQVGSIAQTPEPSTFALLGTGMMGVACVLRRRLC